MDDTKKLIEKYKRELMELSARQKKPPKIIGYMDGDNTFLSGLQADTEAAAKSGNPTNLPENNNRASAELSAAFDEFVPENSGNTDGNSAEPANCPQMPGSGNPGNDNVTEIIDEYEPERPPKNGSGAPDVIFERPGSKNSGNSGNPGNPGGSRNDRQGNNSGNSPDLSEKITEIIDEYEPERPPKCNSEDPESFGAPNVVFERPDSKNPGNPGNSGSSGNSGNFGNPGNSGNNRQGNNSGNSSNLSGNVTEIINEYEPEMHVKSSKDTPNYTAVPSTEAVREGITNTSRPENNIENKNVSGITSSSKAFPGADSAEAIRTSGAQAERLGDQPVSGTSPDEQLTGRSFEPADTPPDTDISMERGSRAEPIEYPEINFTNFEEFEKVNTGKGSLSFRVYTGREAVVIEGAECVITKKIGDETRVIARLTTDNSGQTSAQELPAPPRELSQHYENTIQPFSLYDAQVTKPGFIRVVLKDIPVFDGVQSVQKIFMIVE